VFGRVDSEEGLPGVLSVNPRQPFFGAVVFYAADDRSLIESRDIRVHVIGEVENSGFTLDPEGVRFDSPLGAIGGVRNPGALPLRYKLPGVAVGLGRAGGQFTRFDFTLNSYDSRFVDGSFVIQPGEKFFVGRLLREEQR
jgi:hypothetical protein